MTMKQTAYRMANGLFAYCYPAYFPLYAAWKAFSDRRERRFIRQSIKPGMTIVDVGANIGIYTRFFSRILGNSGRVYAFEPAASNFVRLQETTRGHVNVTLNHAAVGDHNGTAKLYISSELNVDHRTFDSGDGRGSVDVAMVCLDEYFAVGQQVDFVKIDVQGFEMGVLKGASRVLTENRNITIVMEFWPYGLKKAATDPRDIIAFVKALGFSIRPVPESAGPSLDALLSGPAEIDAYCNIIIARP